jgi:hypothetical protein
MIGIRASSTGTRPLAIVGLPGIVAASIAIAVIATGSMAGQRSNDGDFAVVVPAATATPSTAERAAPSGMSSPTIDPIESEEPERDAMPLTVDLVNETHNNVHVDIADSSGLLVGAFSGFPGSGVSVEPYTVEVENIDARTLRLTWSDYAIPNALALYIDGSARRFMLVQPEPNGAVDAMAHDRVLILTFSGPISANHIEAILQDGLDT